MPIHKINLNPFKDRIISWFHNDMSSKDIAESLANDYSIVYTDCVTSLHRKIRVAIGIGALEQRWGVTGMCWRKSVVRIFQKTILKEQRNAGKREALYTHFA